MYTPHIELGALTYEDKSKFCKDCGSVEFNISESKGPHAAGLYCKHCSRFWGWLTHMKVQEIKEAVAK